MRNITFSVIIPSRRNPAVLWLALRSMLNTVTPETEILVVPDLLDNEAPDPATLGMLTGMAEEHEQISVVGTDVARGRGGFPGCANAGLSVARGKYLIVTHDDVVPTAGWLDGLRATLMAAQSAIPDVRWGYVGPMTNTAMVRQTVNAKLLPLAVDANNREQIAASLRSSAMEEFMPSGPLDSFCILMTRQAYQTVGGFDDAFAPGGHEDVDLGLRGQEAGFMSLRSPRVFLFHSGRTTLRETGLGEFGDIPNQRQLMEKWYPDPLDSVVAPTLGFLMKIRLQNVGDQTRFVEQVRHLHELGDQLIILDDRSTVPAIDALTKAGLRDFVTSYRKNPEHLTPNDRRDRTLLLQMGHESGVDWLLGVDQDHWFDPKVTRDVLDDLMTPVDPTIRGYQYPIRTNWYDADTIRVDEDWARRQGVSFFRNLEWGGSLEMVHNREDLFPSCLPFEQVSATAKIALSDRRFLQPEMAVLAPQTPVLAIPSRSPHLTLALMVKNEMHEMVRQAAQHKHWADDMVVVDAGSNDGVQEFCARMGIRCVEYRCCEQWDDPVHMICDFSKGRNFTTDQCKPGFVLQLDGDEELSSVSYVLIPQLLLEDAEGFLCTIHNHQRHPKTGEFQVYQTTQARLFRQHPLLRYEMEVHESLEYALKRHKDQLKLVKTDVTIEHHGYVRERPNERSWKGKQYAELLLKILERDPHDARTYFALGQHYNTHQRFDEGDPLLGRALAIDRDFFTARLELGLRLMKRSYDVFATTPLASVPDDQKRELVQRVLTSLQPWVGNMV